MNTEIKELSPAQLIVETVQKTGNVTDLKELLAIQKDWEANEARKIFAKSFANVQERILSVVKTKTNSQTHSKYADLGNVIESAKPVYTKEGFSVIFSEGDCPKENHIRIFADVLHSAGHKETYHYDVPMDGTGIKGNANMTAIHAKASSTTYGRRYLMCMIWNIPTGDDDGNKAAELKYITEWQIEDLKKLLKDKGFADGNSADFLKYMGVESMNNILDKDFKKAEAAVRAARKVVK